MQLSSVHKQAQPRSEQIILFRCSNELFAISSASVQEVRSVDNLSGAETEVTESSVAKVRHALRRDDKNIYVVSGVVHFGLRPTPPSLIFILRNQRVALLVDAIEKMTTMTRLQALPQAYCHEERNWYRGLTVLDQAVVPVVNPQGFLSQEELMLLDLVMGETSLPAPAPVPFSESSLGRTS